jgi:lipoyl(octanoyl) transferase
MSATLRATWLGRIDYLAAWRLQEAVATRVRSGGPERLLLLEHDPVYTIGRRGTIEHLLVAPEVLRRDGTSVYRVDRGGDITYHGPGQLVGYPITRLAEGGDLVGYVRALELGLRDALATYGIVGRSEAGKTGVWVDLPDGRPAKIAAIGVRVSRGVTTHGFALNVSTDLEGFDRMLPCGFVHEVASLARLGISAGVSEVADRSAVAIATRLGHVLQVEAAINPPADAEIPADAPVRNAVDLLAEAVPA